VEIRELCLEFSRHLTLPRLKNWTVLDKAVAEGLMTPGWDAFGYAMHYNEARGYTCLYFRGRGQKPTAGLLKHRLGYLVKPGAFLNNASLSDAALPIITWSRYR